MVDSSRVAANSFEWPTMNAIEIEKSSNSVLLGNDLLSSSTNWKIDSYTDDRSWWSPRVILQIIDQSSFGSEDFSELEVGHLCSR